MPRGWDDPFNTDWDERQRNDDPYGSPTPPPPPPPVNTDPAAGPVLPPGSTTPVPPDLGLYDPPQYSGSSRPSFSFPNAPTFNPTRFSAPTRAEAENEPGYQMRLAAGTGALQSSAAARGLLRTGGSMKDLFEYGANFASQEYDHVFNRAMQAYGLQYQAERDQFAPLLAQYNNQFGAEQAAGLSAFELEWLRYQAALAEFSRQEDRVADASRPTVPGDVSSHGWWNV